jgi:hypothetical protein
MGVHCIIIFADGGSGGGGGGGGGGGSSGGGGYSGDGIAVVVVVAVAVAVAVAVVAAEAMESISTAFSSSGWFTHNNKKGYISLRYNLMLMTCPCKIIMKSELN